MKNRIHSATVKKVALVLGLAAIEFAAFRVSFEHQAELAAAAGMGSEPWLYPLIIDAAIVVALVIIIWWDDLPKNVAVYIWWAIGVWTGISGLGNAFSTLTAEPGSILIPVPLAVAVNTMPTVTQFFILHIAALALKHRNDPAGANIKKSRARGLLARKDAPASTAAAPAPASPVTEFTDEQLLAMADDRMTVREIAARIGRSPSYTGNRVKKAREDRERAGEARLHAVG